MKKEIKFKYVFQHEETGRILVKVFEIEEIENALNVDDYRRYSIVARCQYTGLKDKLGIEIYEGDITREIKGKEAVDCLVAWSDEYAMFVGCGGDRAKHLTVIGNIYENKEKFKEFYD